MSRLGDFLIDVQSDSEFVISTCSSFEEFCKKMTIDEDGNLILCGDCTASTLVAELDKAPVVAAAPVARHAHTKRASSASNSYGSSATATATSLASAAVATGSRMLPPLSSSSSSSSSSLSHPSSKVAALRAGKRSRTSPKRPPHSYESLLEWCIARFYEERANEGATASLPGGGAAPPTATFQAASSALDGTLTDLPTVVRALIQPNSKPTSQGPPTKKMRKGTAPRKLPQSAP